MPVSGGDIVAGNIIKFGGGFRKHVHKVMDRAGLMLDTVITANMSLQCHTQSDLTSMGHPYSTRYGPYGMGIHDPYWLIHKQTGQLLSSKFRGTSPVDITGGIMRASTWVGLDENKAPHAPHVIWGTSRMIPRDFMTGSIMDPNFQDTIIEHFRINLRDMVLVFRSEGLRGS